MHNTKTIQKQVIPLANVLAKNFALPVILYQAEGLKVTLKALSRTETEEIFGWKVADTDNGEHSMRSVNFSGSIISNDPELLNDLAASSLQLLLEADTSPKGHLLKENVRFATMFALGRGVDVVAVYDEAFSGGSWSLLRSASPTISHRRMQTLTLDQAATDKLKLALTSSYSDNPKLSTIKALLNAATQQIGAADVSRALYFSLLEALYIQDSNPSEKTYKLQLRVTKKLSKDFEFSDKIKKLYGKRSKVIHGTQKGKVFDQGEHKFLEEITMQSLEYYLLNPNEFSANALDKLILQ